MCSETLIFDSYKHLIFNFMLTAEEMFAWQLFPTTINPKQL